MDRRKDTAQGFEGVEAIFARRRDVAADAAEAQEGIEVTEGAGDFLAQLHHPQIALREVVVEGHREVTHEGEDASQDAQPSDCESHRDRIRSIVVLV